MCTKPFSPFVSVSAREWCSHSPPPSGPDQTRAEGCVCVWHKTTRGLWQRGNCPFGQQVSQTHISHTERFIWWWLVHSALSELLSERLNETDITLNVMSCSFEHIRVKWIVVVFLNYIKALICPLAKTLMQGSYFNVNFSHIMCLAWGVCWV